MSDLRTMELRRLDLTLLLVFLGCLRHRKATDVAAELGLTPPAISHALRRLRDVFGDDLFLRRPHGLEPTSVALALEAPVRAAVDALRDALGGPRPFDPATAEGVLRISASDNEQSLIAPQLIARVAAEAPGLRLAFRTLPRAEAIEALVAGDIDLAVGFFWNLPEALTAQGLHDEHYAVAGLPDVIADLTLDRYCALPHLLVSPKGDLTGVVDEALATLGRTRRVIAAVPQFFPALAALSGTGAIATLPRRLVMAHAPRFGLGWADPPLPVRSFTVSVVRHRRDARDGRLDWLIAALRATRGD